MIHLLWTAVFVCIIAFIAWVHWKRPYIEVLSAYVHHKNFQHQQRFAYQTEHSSRFKVVKKHLHVLVEEAQQHTVSVHVVLLDILIF
jgi:hypothetical protein